MRDSPSRCLVIAKLAALHRWDPQGEDGSRARDGAVDGVPGWVRWIIVVGAGLSPILSFWMAGTLRRFVRRKLRQRLETAPRLEGEQARPKPEQGAASSRSRRLSQSRL